MAKRRYHNSRRISRFFPRNKSQGILILSLLVLSVLTGYQLFGAPRVYQSSTTIRILGRQNISGLLTEAIVYEPAALMTSQLQMITSFPVMQKVAERLGMLDGNAGTENVLWVVSGLQKAVAAKVIGATNVIQITAKAASPDQAVALVKATAQVYIDWDLEERRRQVQVTREFIEQQLIRLEERLAQGERHVFNSQLVATYQKRLVELKFQLTSLTARYTAQHPLIRELQGQIIALEEQVRLQADADFVHTRLQREIEADQQIYGKLKERLEETRIEEAQKLPAAMVMDPASLPRAARRTPMQLSWIFTNWKGRS